MTAFSGTDPRTAAVKTGQTVTGVGLLLTQDSGLRVTGAGASEVAVGVSAGESSRDADLAYETSGATVSFFPMGGVLWVASEALTWAVGDVAYASGSGYCDKTSSSQKAIGVYVGAGETVAAGVLVPINTNSAVHA